MPEITGFPERHSVSPAVWLKVLPSFTCHACDLRSACFISVDESGNVAYVGRTNDPVRRNIEHHMDNSRNKDLRKLEVIQTGLSAQQAQVWEQFYIYAFSLTAKDSGLSIRNRRREIAIRKYGKFTNEIEQFMKLQQGFLEDELREMINGNWR